MICYKIDVLAALKAAGYSTYKIRQEKIFGQATLQQMREGKMVSWDNINLLCRLLHMQPGDLMEYVEDEAGEGAFFVSNSCPTGMNFIGHAWFI